jgi:hypothetical protein
MRLPSPVLVHDILPAIFVASHLGEDEGTLESGVQWPGHIVVDPPSRRPVALLSGVLKLIFPLHLCFIPSELLMLNHDLHRHFLVPVEQEDNGAGGDEEDYQVAHDAPQSNGGLECCGCHLVSCHLGGALWLHSSFTKLWFLLPSSVVSLSVSAMTMGTLLLHKGQV